MKKTLLIPLLFGILLNAQVNSFPWLETFEDSSPTQSQWTYEYITGTNSSATNNIFWTIKGTTSVGYYSSTGPYAGSKMAVFDTRSHSRDAIGKFISPILDLSSTSNASLNFFYRNMIWGSDQNELKIYYRTSPTAPWTLITTFNSSVSTFTNSGNITLPSPSATYQIALEGVAKYGYGLDIDNLQVQATTLSTQEISKNKPSLFLAPNPTSEYIKLISDYPLREISIIDTSGKNIITKKNIEKEIQIDVKQLPIGLYIVKYIDENGNTKTSKFIKN